MVSRCPHVQCRASSASRLSVRRANVIPPGFISGVITAKRSSSPIRRSSRSTIGRRAACEPSIVVIAVSRKTTNNRRRGSAACSSASPTVVGSRRAAQSNRALNRDPLELLDPLRDAVFAHLEVGGLEVGHGLAVAGRIDVDPHVAGPEPEGRPGGLAWPRLGGRRRLRRLPGRRALAASSRQAQPSTPRGPGPAAPCDGLTETWRPRQLAAPTSCRPLAGGETPSRS